jgi:hypothetical protein
VLVPVPVACVSEPVPKPDFFTDEQLKALDDYQLPLALWLDRRLRQLYEARIEATLDGCWFPATARGGKFVVEWAIQGAGRCLSQELSTP